MIIITNSEAETIREGERLGRKLSGGAVVALKGELGAGKTVFIRGLALGLGIATPVTSPTFTIVDEHPGKTPLFHFDMYRIGSESELFDIGWDDYIGQGGVCAVEWSDRVPAALPPGAVFVSIEKLGGDSRRLEISGIRETCESRATV